jgi:hypothetical protein
MTMIHSYTIEIFQRRFAALCYNKFSLVFVTISVMIYNVESFNTSVQALFITSVLKRSSSCSSFLDIVDLYVPTKLIRDNSIFKSHYLTKLGSSAR